MVYLSSQAKLVLAIERAHDVTLVAYLLPRGPTFAALAAAARRGARVVVRLEGRPYYDARGGIRRLNRSVADDLAANGVDARLVDGDGSAPVHAKAALVDGRLYLDDVNFARGGEGTIVRDDARPDARALRDAIEGRSDPPRDGFALRKNDALALEAGLLGAAGGHAPVAVESESIGSGNAVYSALERLGAAGCAPRLLVSREALSAKERSLLGRLRAGGVSVRVCSSNEKFALAGSRAWVGSANATSAYLTPRQLDWGVRTPNPAIVDELRAHFEARWQSARALSA
ncbi:MAG TPA: phospholipase D-like domain-containing protein [Candidatus Dormibacteraeota bacterium]|nr:phospholipase D-like domain-containing protein [Candidatus Dormibacteraeota bacterium]